MSEYTKIETAMRLIDADAVLRSLSDDLPYKGSVRRVLIQAPTVDAVPVVRCRDCKYYMASALLAPHNFCFRLKHPEEDRPIGYNFAPDDFCSYGARKHGDGDAEKD